MIKFETGDIFNSSAQCLVNTVNCEGYMGKGIAYQFKQKFPQNNKNYIKACSNGNFKIGNILFFSENGKLIANFPTKDKWKEKSQYSYITNGLDTLYNEIKLKKIKSIAIPPLGCGNGGLDWNKVKSLIINKLTDLPLDVIIFEPVQITIKNNLKPPKMTASHLILIKIKKGLKKFNKLRLQKTSFFINLFSNTDYFKFEEYKFGPYAHSIEILSQQIKDFQQFYNLNTLNAEKLIYHNIISDSVKKTISKFDNSIIKAVNYVNSIKADKELEIISTILFIIIKNTVTSTKDVVDYFFNWSKYDISRFSKDEIINCFNRLIDEKFVIKNLLEYSINKDIIK